jgi:hypothetical protein
MSLRPYKFLIVPVIQEIDEDGNVINEVQTQQPDTAFGVRGLIAYAENFEQVLAEREAVMNGNDANS